MRSQLNATLGKTTPISLLYSGKWEIVGKLYNFSSASQLFLNNFYYLLSHTTHTRNLIRQRSSQFKRLITTILRYLWIHFYCNKVVFSYTIPLYHFFYVKHKHPFKNVTINVSGKEWVKILTRHLAARFEALNCFSVWNCF